MKKIILTIAFIATGMVASAQVGIGNEDPKTTLHVTGANNGAALTAADGVTVPRVSTDMRDSGTAVSGVELGQLVYSTNTNSLGFWFWAGATEKWNPLIAAAAPAFSSIVLEKNATYTTVVPAELTGTVNTLVFTGSNPSSLTLPNLTGSEVGKLVNIYAASTGNITVSFNRAGDGTAASLSVLNTRGYSLIWTATGWARSSY